MRFGIYASQRATRIRKFLWRLPEHARDIGFIIIDHDKNVALRRMCRELDIPLRELSETEAGSDGPHRSRSLSDAFWAQMQQHRTPYAFVFGQRILQGRLLDDYAGRLINFHPSILPMFPGLNAIDKARAAGTFLLGNTAHFITDDIDGGPVIMQNVIHNLQAPDAEAILDKQLLMLLQLKKWLEAGRVRLNSKVATVTGASYRTEEFVPNLELADSAEAHLLATVASSGFDNDPGFNEPDSETDSNDDLPAH